MAELMNTPLTIPKGLIGSGQNLGWPALTTLTGSDDVRGSAAEPELVAHQVRHQLANDR